LRLQDRRLYETAINPPAHRRAGFEVAGWDGARWILEGIYDSGAEAASQAKTVLGRRLGVKVTQEVFNAAEGTFKGRVVFTEFRGEPPKAERKKAPEPPAPTRHRTTRDLLGGDDAALYVSISALVVAILALLCAIIR
jgi:hypothetical protein